jgi:type I restriction enzyme S subunit
MKEIRFKDFITLKRGFDLPKKDRVDGQYPVVASTSVTGYHNEYKVEPPGVTTGRSGSLGEVLYLGEKFWPLNTSLWVKDFKGNYPLYVYYFLKTLNLQEYNSGAGVPTLNRNHLDNIDIAIHDEAGQKKIASILSSFDDLIENNTRRIEILEEMARLIYREWFVHYRYPGHEKDKLVDSGTDFGEIPDGWEVKKIIDLYNTSAGGTPSRKKEEYFGGSIPWVKTKELNDSFIQESEENITRLGLKNSSAKLFPRNTVLVAMYGATVGQLGVLDIDATTNQACCGIIEKTEPFDYSFIYSTLLEYRNKLIGLSQGAAQQNINQGHIKEFQILKPDESILIEFQKQIYPVFDQIRVLKKQSEKLKQTRDLLLPKLISGKVEL